MVKVTQKDIPDSKSSIPKSLLFLLIVLGGFKLDIISLPFHWDAIGYVIPSAEIIYSPGNLLDKLGATVHPPFYYLGLASAWWLFGKSLVVSHIYDLLIGIAGLVFLFLLTAELYGKKTGFLAVILLALNPLFFAQWGNVHLEVAVTAAALGTIYFYKKGSFWGYSICASVMLLTKETAMVVWLSLMIFVFVQNLWQKKELRSIFRGILWLSFPILPLIFWFFLHWKVTGSLVNTHLLINQHIFFSLFLKNMFRYLVFDASLENINSINWLATIFIIGYFINWKKRYKIQLEWLFILIIILNIALFCYTDDMPRYFLIILPFFYILTARAILSITENIRFQSSIRLTTIGLILAIFLSSYHGNRNVDGWRLESNMEFKDFVKLQKSSCHFIETHFPHYKIICPYPLNLAMGNPWYGYVTQKMDVINFHAFDPDQPVLVIWSAQSNFGDLAKFIEANQKSLRLIKTITSKGKTIKIFKGVNKIQGSSAISNSRL